MLLSAGAACITCKYVSLTVHCNVSFLCATCAVTVSEFPSPVWLDHSPVSVATLTGKSSRWTRCTCRWTASSRASAASGWHWAPAKTAMRSAGNVKRQYSADTSELAWQLFKKNAHRASIRKRHRLAMQILVTVLVFPSGRPSGRCPTSRRKVQRRVLRRWHPEKNPTSIAWSGSRHGRGVWPHRIRRKRSRSRPCRRSRRRGRQRGGKTAT